jgi:biopolymer transport protein ExbB
MKFKTTFTTAAIALLLTSFSHTAAAVTYDEIMASIREARAAEAIVLEARENEFQEKLDAAQRLYNEALRMRNEAEALSNRLSNQYDENVIRIEELSSLLTVNQGNLGELFGVTRQIAGDAAGTLSDSLINTQIITPPGQESRVDFLRRIAAATALHH